MASDDEVPYFLLPDTLTGRKRIPHEAVPKVFEGSLKDYQGLEGVRSRCWSNVIPVPWMWLHSLKHYYHNLYVHSWECSSHTFHKTCSHDTVGRVTILQSPTDPNKLYVICTVHFLDYIKLWSDKCTLVGSRFYVIKKMYGTNNIKFVTDRQTKEVYQYKNTKEKLHRTNAAIWYNKLCWQLQLTPKYITIKLNGHNRQSQRVYICQITILCRSEYFSIPD